MSRSNIETALAIADYESAFGSLPYFIEDNKGERQSISPEAALILILEHNWTEVLFDTDMPPFVIVSAP